MVRRLALALMGICLLVSFPGASLAKGVNEKEMKKKAHELSYEGQMEQAQKLMGQLEQAEREAERTTSGGSGSGGSGGWDMTSLMLSMIWGAVGGGYFIYGKKQGKAVFLLCGIGLCAFPLFVSGNLLSLGLGIAMCVAPFKIDF